ncbi:MAG TPA: 5'/3'-nucleotidase SurE [Anaerolineales bacterium]|nr:5'/3'-nucleotidase SurE [Anaerolineales bacterium]
MEKPQILLTNDDGIRSPGLWAAARALASLGYVTVAAPREQSSGTGRSLPNTSSGIIHVEKLEINDQEWTVYAVDGTPAQAVLHAVLEIMPEKPDLIVSGINYGENMGLGITVSGTVGAAMEGASLGFPSLAVSLQAAPKYHLSYSEEIDFSCAAYFTAHFAGILLKQKLSDEIHLLNVNVPSEATIKTRWQVTRLARQRYYDPTPPHRNSWDEPGTVSYVEAAILDHEVEDSDVYVMRRKLRVSVTPISLDMTSRVELGKLEKQLRASNH